MRAFWKQDGVICLKLRDDLYTLAQMVNPVAMMRFYEIFKDKDEWQGVDLNNVKPLFAVAIGNAVIHNLGVRRVPPKEVTPSAAPCERHFIHVSDNAEYYGRPGEFMWKGGRLVDRGEAAKTVGYAATTLIPDLNVHDHRDIILKHEFTNMYGDNHIKNRILQFYDTGVNIDVMKLKVFPDLVL
jgi:hypothetical protein